MERANGLRAFVNWNTVADVDFLHHHRHRLPIPPARPSLYARFCKRWLAHSTSMNLHAEHGGHNKGPNIPPISAPLLSPLLLTTGRDTLQVFLYFENERHPDSIFFHYNYPRRVGLITLQRRPRLTELELDVEVLLVRSTRLVLDGGWSPSVEGDGSHARKPARVASVGI